MPVSSREQSSSTQTLPFPELNKRLATSYVDSLSGFLGNLNGNNNAPGGGAASDFQGYFENVGGPPANFTDITQGGVYTPQQVNEGVNSIYADNDARAANQSRNLNQQLGPGFGANSPLLAELQQSNQGRFQALGQGQAREFGQNAALVNAQHSLARAGAQTNVESLRAGDDQNSRSLGLQARSQDFDRERSLLSLLAGFGGAGGLLGPLTNSQSTASSGVPSMRAKYSRSGIKDLSWDYDAGSDRGFGGQLG